MLYENLLYVDRNVRLKKEDETKMWVAEVSWIIRILGASRRQRIWNDTREKLYSDGINKKTKQTLMEQINVKRLSCF